MFRFALMSGALAALCSVNSTASAHDDPAVIAKRCVDHVNDIVDRCTNAARNETRRCTAKIRELVRQGRCAAAARVGRRCIQSSKQRTRRCIGEVKDICRRCINFLLDIGAETLAKRVRSACADAISDLETIHNRVVNVIKNALGCCTGQLSGQPRLDG